MIGYGMMSSPSYLLRLGYNSNNVPTHFLHLLPIPLRHFLILLSFLCEVVVSTHGFPYCIVPVVPFVHLRGVQFPLWEGMKHVDLHCMEQIGVQEVTHNSGNTLQCVKSSVNMLLPEFGID
jgi:hypothetical protein